MLYQQGDVLIEAVDAIPPDARHRPMPSGRVVLAESDLTGHAHAVHEQLDVFERNGTLYCRGESPFTLRHEEHHAITIPPGTYTVRIVLEYDHFLEESREVQD